MSDRLYARFWDEVLGDIAPPWAEVGDGAARRAYLAEQFTIRLVPGRLLPSGWFIVPDGGGPRGRILPHTVDALLADLPAPDGTEFEGRFGGFFAGSIPVSKDDIPAARAELITATEDAARALALSGEGPEGRDVTRIAYIMREGSRRAGMVAAALWDAEADDKAARVLLKQAFLDTWAGAHDRYTTRAAARAAGAVMPAGVLRALREALGLSRVDLAATLHVSEHTVRAWERGQNPVPEGASAELWEVWEDHTRRVLGQVEPGPVPTLPWDAAPLTVRTAALLLGGQRFTIADPPIKELARRAGYVID